MTLFAVDSGAWANGPAGGRGGSGAQDGGGKSDGPAGNGPDGNGPAGNGPAGGRGGSETQGAGERPGGPGAAGRDQKGGGRGDAPGRGKDGPRAESTRSTASDRSADDAQGGRSYRLVRSRPDLSPHDAALIAVQRQEALPLDQILTRMRPHSSGQVVDAMLVHDGAGLYYRLRVLERSGAVREMFFAAKSGELVAGR